jgi:uncharacterized protein (DUF302 family)
VLERRSGFSHDESVRRLIAAVEQRGLTVFARIDHGAAAREVGLELADEEVVLFGSPRAGTPLMQADPRIGVELPLRVLIWDDAHGTMLGYNDPVDLAARYDVGQQAPTLQAMSTLLAELVAEASS